jgi:hypothetical protein
MKHDKLQKQAQPSYDPLNPDKFPGSTFGPLVPEGPPTDTPGYVTAPDSRGSCRYDALEEYLNDKTLFPHGAPSDACHKFVTENTLSAFSCDKGQSDSILFNTHKALLFVGIGYGADAIIPQLCSVIGSPHNAQIISDAKAFSATGRDGTPAMTVEAAVAAWRKAAQDTGKPYYPRTPFADATDPPKQLGT